MHCEGGSHLWVLPFLAQQSHINEIYIFAQIPSVLAQPPLFHESAMLIGLNAQRQAVMNDAINATIVTMVGNQPLATICDMLRQAYQRDIEILSALDETIFRPGEYVYQRTKTSLSTARNT